MTARATMKEGENRRGGRCSGDKNQIEVSSWWPSHTGGTSYYPNGSGHQHDQVTQTAPSVSVDSRSTPSPIRGGRPSPREPSGLSLLNSRFYSLQCIPSFRLKIRRFFLLVLKSGRSARAELAVTFLLASSAVKSRFLVSSIVLGLVDARGR